MPATAKTSRRISALILTSLVMYLINCMPVRADSLSGASLFDSVLQYASFGDHRTGGKGDHSTTEWLVKELEDVGFAVEPQVFVLNQFFPKEQSLLLGEHGVEVFPHWFPRATHEPIQAPLASIDRESLSGKIAYLPPSRAGLWYQLQPAQIAEDAAARGAVALVIAVPHPSEEIYVTNASPPHLQQPVEIPTVILAARDHSKMDRAMQRGIKAILTSDGEVQEVKARNLLARFPAKSTPGRPWVVISTPLSGWFTCAGERGTGVALWLGLARWISDNNFDQYNWLFVGNSGHELDFMGAHHSISKMPEPENVRLWMHLGASIGARQWRDDAGQLIPLNKIHQYNRVFSDEALMPLISPAFSAIPDLEILPNSALKSDQSELAAIAKSGYSALGFVGAHRFFHTPADTPAVTDSRLLDPYGEALKKLAKSLVQDEP